jgi:exodeoxyribonuclease VII small subunit
MADFEKELEKLEDITRRLQSGEEGIEKSMALYTEGVKLAEALQKKLKEYKTKIDILEAEGDASCQK